MEETEKQEIKKECIKVLRDELNHGSTPALKVQCASKLLDLLSVKVELETVEDKILPLFEDWFKWRQGG